MKYFLLWKFSLLRGLTIDAGVDLTGGIPESIKISDISKSVELFKDLNKVYQKGAFLSCSLRVSFKLLKEFVKETVM